MSAPGPHALLVHQAARGPLPRTPAQAARWLREAAPSRISITLPLSTADRERARAALGGLGIVTEDATSGLRFDFPADGDALDRCLELAGLPPLGEGGARHLLAAGGPLHELPALSLPLRVPASEARAMGCGPAPVVLSILIGNVRLRQQDLTLERAGDGPVVAVCAELSRPLEALSPPSLAGFTLGESQRHGVPALRLGGGLFSSRVRLEQRPEGAVGLPDRPSSVARAEAFLRQLDATWGGALRSVLEVSWPAWRLLDGGGLVDGAGEALLPLPA